MTEKERLRITSSGGADNDTKKPELGVAIFSSSPTCVSEGEQTRPQVLKARDGRIDSVKFWLIVLVITAHVIMRKEFTGSTACFALWNWLCLFTIPLFIFISGYYSRKKDWQAFWPSIWKLSEPLIIFQVIGLLFYADEPLSIRSVLTPWFMLWYLLSLIYWRLILQMIPDRILKHTKLVVITTFCIGILAGFLPFDRFLSLQRTLALMPFFFLGYCIKGKNLYLPDKYKLLCLVFLIVILATPYKSVLGAAIRMMVFALAVPMYVAFVNVCYHSLWTARQGRMSLQYYLYHALLVPPNSALIIPPLIMLAEKLNVPMTFVTAVIIIIGTIAILAVALKIPYVKALTNPSSALR